MIWIARPGLVNAAFSSWFFAVLGIIFLPFTTLMYVILYTPGFGLRGWDWFWIVLALFFDLAHWAANVSQRRQIPGYPGH
ncbi:hypothetical protein ACIBHX_36520 [Nonomuraea sp. NPDC050536]|uniref:hypothetical protein n=1 Tax=Nonomuraea sp. NPDC050536 TaxID=3364366 RepID=UPI0037C6AAA4